MNETELLEEACSLATRYHAGQEDFGGHPYFEHPLRVAKALRDPKAKIVALLHDLLEDTNCTELELKNIFPSDVVEAIRVLIHEKGKHHMSYIRRLAENQLAIQVRIEDLTDNLDPERRAGNSKKAVARRAKYQEALDYLLSCR